MTMIRYENPLVFGAGAANFDINCIIKEPPLVMKDSNLVSMVASSGGVTRNILENLARLGVQSAMLSAYGDDAYGDRLRRILILVCIRSGCGRRYGCCFL